MESLEIIEMRSDQLTEYAAFLGRGLVEDEAQFRIAPEDEVGVGFPTMDRADHFTLSARIAGELAGVASFAREGQNRVKLRHKGLLFRMYVAPQFRGRGIARALIEAVVERVRALGDIEQINLTVIGENAGAKRLYENLGFETFASERNALKWNGMYYSEDQMVLRL